MPSRRPPRKRLGGLRQVSRHAPSPLQPPGRALHASVACCAPAGFWSTLSAGHRGPVGDPSTVRSARPLPGGLEVNFQQPRAREVGRGCPRSRAPTAGSRFCQIRAEAGVSGHMCALVSGVTTRAVACSAAQRRKWRRVGVCSTAGGLRRANAWRQGCRRQIQAGKAGRVSATAWAASRRMEGSLAAGCAQMLAEGQGRWSVQLHEQVRQVMVRA